MPILQRSHAPAQQSIQAEIDRQQRDTDLDRRCQKAVVDLPPDLGHFGQADIIQRENLVERAAAIGQRMQAAIDEVWPFTHELFESDDVTRSVAESGIGVDPATLREAWEKTIGTVLQQATLETPTSTWKPTGGRTGVHTEALSYLLAEMQVLHRAHSGARW